jgi:tetratricopeptide (TPR) repeat protein
MPISIRRVMWGVTLLSLAASPRARAADETVSDTLISKGVELRKRGDNEKAEQYLRKAYELDHTPRAAAQFGLVEYALERFDDAERYLSIALTSKDTWIEQHRKVMEESRVAIRKHLVPVEVLGAPPDSTILLEGKEPFALPADKTIWLKPGLTSVQVEAPGRNPVTRLTDTRPGEHMTIDVSSSPVPAAKASATESAPPPVRVAPVPASPTTEPAGDSGRALRLGGTIVGATGVAAGVAGVVLYEIAGSKLDRISAARANHSSSYDASDLNWQSFDHAGVALMVGGVVALAGGAALYLVGSHEHEHASPATAISFRLSPGGGVVHVGGAF